MATLWVGLRCGLGHQQPAVNVGRIGLRSAQRDRGVTHRAAAASGGSRRALHNRSVAAFPIRSPPRQAWGRDCCGRGRLKTSRCCRVAPEFMTPVRAEADASNSSATKRTVPVSSRVSLRGLGFEEPQVSIFTPLRCRLCRWKRQQAYQIDFKPNEYGGGFLFLREPVYVCHRCLARYQTDARVRRITRVLSESEVAT
jgi:hypothetical protein